MYFQTLKVGSILSRNIRLEVVGEASYGVLANLT